MFRFIKIIFNAIVLSLAFMGFNAIGGERYVEAIKVNITNFIQERIEDNTRKIGNFSELHEEFQIDKSVDLLGYKAILAEHKSSGQKMAIIDSGKRPLLTEEDIKNDNLETKIKGLTKKIKYQGFSFQELKITNHGNINVYGQTVPYARFEAKVTKLPFSDLSGIIASVTTSDNSSKLIVSISEKKKYSQLISDEFYKAVKED